MNLELLENFGQNYPEDYDGALDCFSMALTSQFNRQGTLLAVGCNDGRLVIWDFLTRGYHCAVESGRFAWIKIWVSGNFLHFDTSVNDRRVRKMIDDGRFCVLRGWNEMFLRIDVNWLDMFFAV